MYNLRYHIASLVAVFLALALGLVLGGVIVERGTLDAQRTAIVNSLRKDFSKLTNQNKALQRQLTLQGDFARAAQADFAKDRLKGARILLLTNAGRDDATQPTRKALEQAGAAVSVVTIEKPGFGVDTDAVKKELESRLASGTPIEAASIVASLAAEWTGESEQRPISNGLVESRAITLQDLDPGTRIEGVVIVAANDGNPDSVVLELGKAFQNGGRPVVGAESQSRATGVAAAAAGLGLGAVNAVNTAPGGWSLVEMLSGGKPAFYGEGAEADAAFAPLPPVASAETSATN